MTKTVLAIFFGLLVLSPLAFGTVEQWSLTLMEAAIFLAAALYAGSKKSGRGPSVVYEVPGIVPLLFFLLYILFQLVPLPAFAVKILSPGAYELYAKTVWPGSPGVWRPLSIHNKATLLEFFRIASYACFYGLTVQLLAGRQLLKRTVQTVISFSALLAFFSIIQQLLSNNKIFWVRELTRGGIMFGPYVNRNHYAGLAGMLFPIALAVFFYYRPGRSYGSFREKLSEVFSHRMINTYFLYGFSAVLIATSVFVSLSRGGMISICFSTTLAILLIMLRERKRKPDMPVVLTIIVILYSVGWFGWSRIFERFAGVRGAGGEISGLRSVIWKDSLKIVRDFPLTGAGFGSFADIFNKYRSMSSFGSAQGSAPGIIEHAHNDYIELLTNGGLIALILFGWFMFEVLYSSFTTFRKRQENYSAYLFIGSLAGIASLLVHSLIDFNMQIGANGLYFFFLLGLAVSASHTRLREGLKDTYLKRIEGVSIKTAAVIICLVFAGGLLVNAGVLGGKFYFALIKNSKADVTTSSGDLATLKKYSLRAAASDPLEAEYKYAAANAEWLSNNKAEALELYKKAVALNPANGEYLQALGLALSNIKRTQEADSLLRTGIEMDGFNPVRYTRYGSWLMSRGRMEEGISNIRQAISLEPDRTRDYITLMVLYGLNNEGISKALPKLVKPHFAFADYLVKTGRDDLAEAEFRNALDLTVNEKPLNPEYFYHVSRYYLGKGKTDEALGVINRALEALPANADVHMEAGRTYEKAGISYRAAEEYRKALILSPGNEDARKRLERLKDDIQG